MPMVEVVTPDGQKELWAAATGHSHAVDAVRNAIPANHVATLTSRRLPHSPKMEGFHYGEVRRVEP
jgi:hypothetical protein